MARDGKLAPGSIGKCEGPRSGSGPSGPAAAAGEKVAPSQRNTNAMSQRISRTAVWTMASNTGCTSVGDWLITRRISDVAVCRSSASLVSLKSRAFSIAITAW